MSVVTDWVAPAMPPPAMIAAAHFTIGGRSVSDGGRDDRAGDEQHVVASVSSRLIDAGNVIGEDLHARPPRRGGQDERRQRAEPGKVFARTGDARYRPQHLRRASARRTEARRSSRKPDAKRDRQGEFEFRHVRNYHAAV